MTRAETTMAISAPMSLAAQSSRRLEGDTPPRPQDVARRVDIPVMGCPAVATYPRSHSQTLLPSRRARRDCSTAGTGLGAVPLVRFNEHGSVPNGLIAEHRAKRGPACIQDGLRHLGADKFRAVHIPNADQGIFPDDARGDFVQKVPALSGNLPVQFPSQRHPSGPLRPAYLLGRAAVELRRSNLLSVGKCREVFQAQINADLAVANGKAVADFTVEIQVPMAVGVFAEAARADTIRYLSGKPKAVGLAEIRDSVAVDCQGTAAVERHPPKGPLCTGAGAPPWALPRFVSALCELKADADNGVGVQPKYFRRARRQTNQVKTARPGFVVPSAGILNTARIVPHLIDGNCHLAKSPRGGLAFYSIAVSQNRHGCIIAQGGCDHGK